VRPELRPLWLVAAGLLGSPAAQSKPPDPESPTQLGTVVVTATRQAQDALQVPAAVDVIGVQALRLAQPRLSLSESLPRIPGVVARERNNYAQDLQISIRGFGARASFGVRGVRLYSDGIPATAPDGQGQISHFALEAADRIEVLRGPFSALYGNSAGGVISIFSAPPPEQAGAGAGQVFGADGLRRSSLWMHAPWGDAGGARLDLAQLDTDGYRDHSAARRQNGQALARGRLADRVDYTVLANHVDLRAQDPQGLTAAQLQGNRRAASAGALAFDTRKTVRQTQLGVRLGAQLADDHGLALTTYRGERDTAQMLSVPVAAQANPLNGGGAIDLARDYRGADLRWQWQTEFLQRPLAFSAGAERQVSDERRRGFENFVGSQRGVVGALRRDEQNRVTGEDVYLQADWELAEHWRLNLGARRNQVDFRSRDFFITAANPDDSGRIEYSRTLPVAGVLFRAAPWLSVYANAGSGFETPTFAELAYRSDGLSGLNDSLSPARSRSAELGLRAQRERWEASAALFQSDTRDELVVASSQGGRTAFANGGRTRRRGLELLSRIELAPDWQWSLTYTGLDARYRDDVAGCGLPPCAPGSLLIVAGRRLPGLSRHQAWSELRWRAADGLDLLLEARASSRVYADDGNRQSAPGQASFDLGAERRFTWGGLDWRAYARVNNLLDREIIGSVIVNEANQRYFEPAPGRHWLLGLDLQWAQP
jgi:iron complex outermembrane receptor protein